MIPYFSSGKTSLTQASALSVRGKPIYGRHTVNVPSRISFWPFPTALFPHMRFDLRLQPRPWRRGWRRSKLPLLQIQPLTVYKVAKAVGGKIILYIFLVVRRGSAHRVDGAAEMAFCAAMPAASRPSPTLHRSHWAAAVEYRCQPAFRWLPLPPLRFSQSDVWRALVDRLPVSAGGVRRTGALPDMAPDLMHRLVCDRHHQNEQLRAVRRPPFFGTDSAVDQSLL